MDTIDDDRDALAEMFADLLDSRGYGGIEPGPGFPDWLARDVSALMESITQEAGTQ